MHSCQYVLFINNLSQDANHWSSSTGKSSSGRPIADLKQLLEVSSCEIKAHIEMLDHQVTRIRNLISAQESLSRIMSVPNWTCVTLLVGEIAQRVSRWACCSYHGKISAAHQLWMLSFNIGMESRWQKSSIDEVSCPGRIMLQTPVVHMYRYGLSTVQLSSQGITNMSQWWIQYVSIL